MPAWRGQTTRAGLFPRAKAPPTVVSLVSPGRHIGPEAQEQVSCRLVVLSICSAAVLHALQLGKRAVVFSCSCRAVLRQVSGACRATSSGHATRRGGGLGRDILA